jgi:Zn-dependent peptidase ImmA (M78 family)/transcriptional regulator with XRE-family HTH domain
VFNLVDELNRRHLTLEKAAEKSGISLHRLEQIAAGQKLTLHELRTLSKKLKIPMAGLSPTRKTTEKAPDFEVLFRSTVQQSGKNTTQIIASLSKNIAAVVDLANELPSNTGWLTAFRQVTQEGASAEVYARYFRDRFFGGDQESPLVSLPSVASHGLQVNVMTVPDLPVEGASVLYNDQAYVFLAPRRFKARMLFTLAHELGHFVASHHSAGANFATFDSENELKPWRRQSRGVEEFANAFASALLLPADSVAIALKEIREQFKISGPLGDIEISYLARFFGVSFEVAGRRCENLGLLPDFGARVLYEKVCQEHGNPERRADAAGLPAREAVILPSPDRLVDVAARRIRAGELSIGRAAETLHVTLSDLFHANSEIGE